MREVLIRGRGASPDSIRDQSFEGSSHVYQNKNAFLALGNELSQALHELGFVGRLQKDELSAHYVGKWPIRPAHTMVSARFDVMQGSVLELCHLKSGNSVAFREPNPAIAKRNFGAIVQALSLIPENQAIEAVSFLMSRYGENVQVRSGETLSLQIDLRGLHVSHLDRSESDMNPQDAIRGTQCMDLRVSNGHQESDTLSLKIIPHGGIAFDSNHGEDKITQNHAQLVQVSEALNVTRSWLDNSLRNLWPRGQKGVPQAGAVKNQVLGRVERLLSERI